MTDNITDKVLAIIVCYNPDLTALDRTLYALAGQQCTVLIVDNASSNVDGIRKLVSGRVALIEQATNLGLGAAHNTGIKHAQQNGYSHVLLLDQDSVPLDAMLEKLLVAHQRKSLDQNVSAVGATYLNADNGTESFFVRFGRLKFQRQYCGQRDRDDCIQADFLISSGSLLALDTIEQVGLMDETLFIDHVDTEWFLRARAKGYAAFGVCEAIMQHGLGEQTHRVAMGGRWLSTVFGTRQRNVPQHKPFRYYYIFRNSVLLYKRRYSSGLWKWNDVQRLGMIMLMFGFLKAPRLANLQAMFRGISDGLKGVTGPVDV